MHCILELTFARIFLFLELPFLQEAQFYRENLSQSSSLEESSDLPAITVTCRRDHFMRGEHAALFLLGILNSARESSHPQCSKNKKIRAKVDSEGLYGRGRLLFMGSCPTANLLRIVLSESFLNNNRLAQFLGQSIWWSMFDDFLFQSYSSEQDWTFASIGKPSCVIWQESRAYQKRRAKRRLE